MPEEVPKNIEVSAPATINVGHSPTAPVGLTAPNPLKGEGNVFEASLMDKLIWPVVVFSGVVMLAMVIISIAAPEGSALLLIGAVVAFATPTLAAVIGMFKSAETGKKVDALHVIVNSRLSELLIETAKASKAEGKAEAKNENTKDAKG